MGNRYDYPYLILMDGCWGEVYLHLQEAQAAMKAALDPESLAQYAIVGRDAEFETLGGKIPASGLVSIQAGSKEKKKKSDAPLYKKADKKQKQQNGFKDRKGGQKKQKL